MKFLSYNINIHLIGHLHRQFTLIVRGDIRRVCDRLINRPSFYLLSRTLMSKRLLKILSSAWPVPSTALPELASGVPTGAQSVGLTGALNGRITGQSGAAAPKTRITLRSLGVGREQSPETNRAGLYQSCALMPGAYSLTARVKVSRRESLVRVLVGDITPRDVEMRIGTGRDRNR